MRAEVIENKGHCNHGHKLGDVLDVDCNNAGGMCGFFYHSIFPQLNVMEFGGKYPWAPDGELILECPDRANAVVVKLSPIA